jgi:hypothetical protein
MLEELSGKLDTWQMEEESRGQSLFTILFSDIGKKFYAQFGWRPFQSSHISLPAVAREVLNGAVENSTTRALRAEDIKNSMCDDVTLAKVRERMQIASQSPGAKIAIIPDFDHFIWHWAREEFYAEKLLAHRSPPTIKGAGDDQARVYCAWNRNFGETPENNVLYILRWVYDDPKSAAEEQVLIEAMAGILRRAQLEAHEWNMSKVEFWNPSPLLEKAVSLLNPTAEVVHREESSIASLRWTGADQGLGKNVTWLLNEKFTWC